MQKFRRWSISAFHRNPFNRRTLNFKVRTFFFVVLTRMSNVTLPRHHPPPHQFHTNRNLVFCPHPVFSSPMYQLPDDEPRAARDAPLVRLDDLVLYQLLVRDQLSTHLPRHKLARCLCFARHVRYGFLTRFGRNLCLPPRLTCPQSLSWPSRPAAIDVANGVNSMPVSARLCLEMAVFRC